MKGLGTLMGSLTELGRFGSGSLWVCVVVVVGVLGGCAQEAETTPTPTPTQPWWVEVYLEDRNTLLAKVKETISPDGNAGACVRGELSESQLRHQQALQDSPSWHGVPTLAYSLEYICAEALEHTHKLLDDGANGDRLTGSPPSLNSREMEQLQPYTGECLDLVETRLVIEVARAWHRTALRGWLQGTGAVCRNVPEVRERVALSGVELPNPYEMILQTVDGEQVEIPWDFARHYCDESYRPTVEAIAMRGRQTLGERVRRLRESAGLTQEALAGAANVGRVTLVRIERGEQSPRYRTLTVLAQALDRGVPRNYSSNLSSPDLTADARGRTFPLSAGWRVRLRGIRQRRTP